MPVYIPYPLRKALSFVLETAGCVSWRIGRDLRRKIRKSIESAGPLQHSPKLSRPETTSPSAAPPLKQGLMSGATMGGVQVAHAEALYPQSPRRRDIPEDTPDGLLTHVLNSLTIVDLQLVTFIVVLGTSGNVPLYGLVFPLFASVYIAILSVFVFPPTSREVPPKLFRGSQPFKLYVLAGALIGLFLPMAYILGGFSRGDTESVLASSPHLFLLSCQILTENVIHGFRSVSLPVRALTPILYNSVRLCALYQWVSRVLTRVTPVIPDEAMGFRRGLLEMFTNTDLRLWFSFGKALAIVNFVFWHVNLFGFLVCVFLPRAMGVYYQARPLKATKSGMESVAEQYSKKA